MTDPAPDRDPGARPLRLVALVKQTPRFEAMELGADGRIVREGLELEMGAYCRRATAQAVALAAAHGGSVTVVTMGPPSARAVLREALTYADEHQVAVRGVLVSDPQLAGADTLATAQALAAALRRLEADGGPTDLILCGRNSVDADTGQVGPELAQLLDLPFRTGVKRLDLEPAQRRARVGCELDDLWEEATVELPAVLSAAERLIDPCKITDPARWVPDDDDRIVVVDADALGPGPWGAAASPTRVGRTRAESTPRAGRILDGPVAEQVAEVVAALVARGLHLEPAVSTAGFGAPSLDVGAVPPTAGGDGPIVAVVAEPGRDRLTRELAGAAAVLAAQLGGRVALVGPGLDTLGAATCAAWGADGLVHLDVADHQADDVVEEDVAGAVSGWAAAVAPWAVLVGGTAWGREVGSRVAAALGAGLTGDAVGFEVDGGRLVAWKPAFGGAVVAAIHCSSSIQLATVRVGVLPRLTPRPAGPVVEERRSMAVRGRVRVTERRVEDSVDVLAEARRVVGVGQGVAPERYGELDGLLDVLGAELAATRKVTDQGWLPHARQLGITGRAIEPDLYLALGTSGKYNHMVGVRAAGLVVAVNPDATAPVFGFADLGIVGDWDVVVEQLVAQLRAAR